MTKYSGLILIPTNRRKRRPFMRGVVPGRLVTRRGETFVQQFNGDLRPVRPGEAAEPYHQRRG